MCVENMTGVEILYYLYFYIVTFKQFSHAEVDAYAAKRGFLINRFILARAFGTLSTARH